MRPFSVPDILIEPCPERSKKRRRLDCFTTGVGPHREGCTPPLAFNIANRRKGDVVCFGMIDGLPVLTHPDSTVLQPCEVFTVNLHCDHTLRRQNDDGIVGKLDRDIIETLGKLADQCIEFQFAYVVRRDSSATQRRRNVGVLEVILYGPKCVTDAVGLFMEDCGYCLQDPYNCDRNVPYINPHRLSSLFDDPPMTHAMQQPGQEIAETSTRAFIDALANFQSSEQFEVAMAPSALVTSLQLHQKQALNFFRRREMGLGRSDLDCGIWEPRTNASNAQVYLNTVTGQEQLSPPPVWRGGILADEMGLGKTLSMIALVAGDKDLSRADNYPTMGTRNINGADSTLIIVPHNVLSSWETQLKRHVHPGHLTWVKHQGRNRIRSEPGVELPDIVFTTYQTVESEYRRAKEKRGALFSIQWRRIILDEAHIIRNWKTSTAKGIGSLAATSRWAVSGTPIQNGLQDLLGLFKFLQFQPYHDPRVFEGDIAGMMRTNTLDESIERMMKLLSCIMIRRTKATAAILLPPKVAEVVRLRFTPQEQAHYENIEQPAANILDNEHYEVQASGSLWLTALQQIHSLRLACNLGIADAPSSPALALSTLGNDDPASRMLSARLLMGDGSCQHCLAIFDLPQAASSRSDNDACEPAYYSICYKLFCASCAGLFHLMTPKPCDCEEPDTPCTLQPIPLQHITPASTPIPGSVSPGPDAAPSAYYSTKVLALVSNIIKHLDEKSVVFSFWTSTLDMVERAMKQANIECVRIDGKVSPSTRNRLLDQFRHDPDVKVMLITTSCGAVGIDLTAATRAYMLEPQWNPTVEEQAMARIHRIGQTRPVTAIRYIMEGSIEEHIIDVVQDRKKLLVSLLLPHQA